MFSDPLDPPLIGILKIGLDNTIEDLAVSENIDILMAFCKLQGKVAESYLLSAMASNLSRDSNWHIIFDQDYKFVETYLIYVFDTKTSLAVEFGDAPEEVVRKEYAGISSYLMGKRHLHEFVASKPPIH